MNKPAPNWAIWLHMRRLSADEAIALSFGIEPGAISRDSRGAYATSGQGLPTLISGFDSRERLYLRNHDRRLSPQELAAWALQVGWNIPVALARLVPGWKPAVRTRSAVAVVNAALAACSAPGTKPDDLRKTVESLGARFVRVGSDHVLVLPDGSVEGKRIPLAQACSALSGWYAADGPTRVLGAMLRGSGASGSGARPSAHQSQPPLASVEPAPPTAVAQHDDRKALARRMRSEGKTDEEIARAIGVSRPRISQLIGSRVGNKAAAVTAAKKRG